MADLYIRNKILSPKELGDMKKQIICIIAALLLSGCMTVNEQKSDDLQPVTTASIAVSETQIETRRPAQVTSAQTETRTHINSSFGVQNGHSAYCEVNGNVPFFTDEEKACTKPFEIYSDLDPLGRCGPAYANVCKEIMPTEERGKIGMIKPSGWHTSKYDKSVIPDIYLYNRCHLIAYMLSSENANEKNLITGTRYLNVEGMLPFETRVGNYIENNPDNHVLYRVTPVFEGDDLVATGVQMEAWSVEDNGEGVSFCVFCYNIQPGITIDYATGDNWLDESSQTETETSVIVSSSSEAEAGKTYSYVLNTNTKKIHLPSCESVKETKEKNKAYSNKTIDELKNEGYKPCQRCNPS